MSEIRTHRDLEVWKKSINLITDIYELTKNYPKDELFSLTSQIRRAAISIPSNIAEGSARNHDKEFIQFLYISLGSCSELETQLIISFNLKYIDKSQMELFDNKIFEIRRMLLGLIRGVRKS